MNISELVIDAYKTLGQSMFLTEVRPVYEYRNGHLNSIIHQMLA